MPITSPTMRSIVVVPTYQEVDNIGRFLEAVRAAQPDLEVLVVDDNSPDGTADVARRVGERLGGVDVLVRAQKDGLGNAYRDGFAQVLAGARHDVVIQMDSDLSHRPETIADLVAAVEGGADCVIGSRYVPGGSTPGWPYHRRALSRYGNLYTSAVLRLGIRDATSGFRAYRAGVLDEIDIASTRATGYAFMSEVASRLVHAGATIVEVPITFEDRRFGTSKMSTRIIAESMLRVTRWGVTDRLPGRSPSSRR